MSNHILLKYGCPNKKSNQIGVIHLIEMGDTRSKGGIFIFVFKKNLLLVFYSFYHMVCHGELMSFANELELMCGYVSMVSIKKKRWTNE